ncbi:MAG: nitronate monooxygenase [Bauldia sp.]|nr:nitronate monooxygenase [Bauldia sp.]
MRIATRLTDRLRLRHPIISAPMGFAAGGALAGAVSTAGGLGLIGGGYGDSDWLAKEFKRSGNRPVGCGFITWSLARNPGLLDQALDRNPRAIFLSFGDPEPFASSVRAAGVPLICQVQSLDDARRALDVGADVVVAQGAEAGGHGEKRATFTFVPEVVDLVRQRGSDALVCAAGGVADGRGLAAALMLGADGVVMGSRFWASSEALVHPNLHRSALAASGDDTVRTSVMDIARRLDWPSRFTLRVRKNAFTESWHGHEADLLADIGTQSSRYRDAWANGDPATAAVMVGEAAGLIHDIEPAGDILLRTVSEAVAVLQNATSRLLVDDPLTPGH